MSYSLQPRFTLALFSPIFSTFSGDNPTNLGLTMLTALLGCTYTWPRFLRTHIALAGTGPEHIYLSYIRHHAVARQLHNENDAGHDKLFVALICVVLVIDGPLTFLDFLISQGSVKHLIVLHVHIVHVCLCLRLCVSNRTVSKHTSSNCARAKW